MALRRNQKSQSTSENERQAPAPPRRTERQATRGVRSALDQCADALVQAMINARRF